MSSIIAGYNYDIFISYRQKDNKGDKWVSEFVEALKTELESTFKEEISVYFDINPHDGLLETHDVDASLKEKLKCLVFIPIVSRTYCDPKSFAWEHEFKAFVEQASQDRFGLKIKLPNGNVANRVLPIRIHDLDNDDIRLCESVLGAVLRGVEFIYKEPGVNKPLTTTDNEKKNLNNTTYKIQINKVANAIDEIFHGLKVVQTSPEGRRLGYEKSALDSKGQNIIKELTGILKVNQRPKKWLIILLSAVLCIVCAFPVFKIIGRIKKNNDIVKLEKSIAVLPFVNDSPDQENTYFINGIMEEILNNLQRIKDFRVLSRTSTEQFRGSTKPTIAKIAKDLDVNYIVEGSGQKYGNTFRLRIQLLAAKNEKHLWGESYEQDIKETEDFFKIQSQIAQDIAEELKASITPEERHLIEKIPTTSLKAYDFYKTGFEEIMKYGPSGLNRESVNRAKVLFHNALECDSTYALAYTGLANAYWKEYYLSNESNIYLDSMLIMAEIALSYDDKLAEAYFVRGGYYFEKGYAKETITEWDKAIRYNPNNYQAYWGKGFFYGSYFDDQIQSIKNIHKAISLNHDSQLPAFLKRLGEGYFNAGFPENGKYYLTEALKLDGDTVSYMDHLIDYTIMNQGNYKEAIEHYKMRYLRDSTNNWLLGVLGYDYLFSGQYKESLKYYQKYISRLKGIGQYDDNIPYIGYAYWQNGYRKEAEYYFNKQLEISNNYIKSHPELGKLFHTYILAGIYAINGDSDKAYENLKIWAYNKSNLWRLTTIKNDPLFNSIRSEPGFREIVRDLEAKYKAEHERVRKWLEEQGKL